MLDALPRLGILLAPGGGEGGEACWTIFQSAVIGAVLKELCPEVLNQSMKTHVIVRTAN